jgi:hypothetical protein
MSYFFRQSEIRIDWARKKLDEMKQLIYAGNAETANFAIRENTADGPKLIFRFMDFVQPEAVRLISEFLFHGRSALDYIVFRLAFHNTTREQDGTQFPICDSQQYFEKIRKRRDSPLRHLTGPQIALVERVQPYNGFPVLALLNRISNRDKHREFVLAPAESMRRLVPITDTHGSPRGLPSNQVGMEYHVIHDVLLDDGTSAIETLRILHTLLSQILNEFDTLMS